MEAICLSRNKCKGSGFGILVGILFPFVHFLFERFGFPLISKRQSNNGVLGFKTMEKGSILVVDEGIKYLLIPDYAAVRGLSRVSVIIRMTCWSCAYTYIYQLDPVGVSDQVFEGLETTRLTTPLSSSERIEGMARSRILRLRDRIGL